MKTYKIIINLGYNRKPKSFITMGTRAEAIAKGHRYISDKHLLATNFSIREVL